MLNPGGSNLGTDQSLSFFTNLVQLANRTNERNHDLGTRIQPLLLQLQRGLNKSADLKCE